MPSKYGVRMRRPNPEASQQTEQHHQQHALGGQVDHEHPQQPQRPPPAREHRCQRGRDEQPHGRVTQTSDVSQPISCGRQHAPAERDQITTSAAR